MRKVEVHTTPGYEVLIRRKFLSEAGRRVLSAIGSPCRAALMTDDLVYSLYGTQAEQSFQASGFQVSTFVFPNGEQSKNTKTYVDMLEFLAAEHLTRTDLIIALGGGVVGDMAGFAAATYLRGIRFVQIPTTLLAMVDSSVGGKTGVDLKAGKNLAGAFWQPKLVLCDCDSLSSLPEETFLDGVAEALKYGVIASEELFWRFESGTARTAIEEVITECVSLKRDVVEEDAFDNGRRQLLNYGHTFGHAIERESGFQITHGHAVATGMVIAAFIAAEEGLCTAETAERIRACIKALGLPVDTDIPAERLLAAALSDKKRRGDQISLILPRRIGCCELYPVPVSELLPLLSAGLLRMRAGKA